MKYFRLIWAGLWRKRTRTIFTMLSIVVAFLLFGLLQGINQGFNTVVQNLNVDRLYVSAKTNMTDGLPISYLSRIKTVPGVRAVSHWTYFGGYYQTAQNRLPAFAAAVGLLLASMVFPALRPIFGDFKMPMIVVAMGAGMALVLAFVSGFPPAWRAKQLNIVDALAGR